jgi:hypothetical protein
MTTDTDIRLRSRLDANQRDREQMCRAVLAINPHYSDVRPRHPLGGPDGGRDIEAVFDGERTAYGAVGFINSANDSDEQKKRIRAKFTSDLASACGAKPDLKVFAFLTNLHFTLGEQAEMKEETRLAGVEHCDILDRERLRIELDSAAGFFIRFQYLGIPLSEAEQASFLAHYGDRIQEVVSTGFQRIERTLNRILFLQESAQVLDTLTIMFRLKGSYPAEQIAHFRAFVSLSLRAIKHDIFRILFGATDKSGRFSEEQRSDRLIPGIANGISHAQWEHHINLSAPDDEPSKIDKYVPVGLGSGVGMDPVSAIWIRYTHDQPLIRFQPRLELRDLDDCMFLPLLNESLAGKVESVHVYANGYKLLEVGIDDFEIDTSTFQNDIPVDFSEDELVDGWVRLRPLKASAFHLRFNEQTPRRMYASGETPDTPQAKTE